MLLTATVFLQIPSMRPKPSQSHTAELSGPRLDEQINMNTRWSSWPR